MWLIVVASWWVVFIRLKHLDLWFLASISKLLAPSLITLRKRRIYKWEDLKKNKKIFGIWNDNVIKAQKIKWPQRKGQRDVKWKGQGTTWTSERRQGAPYRRNHRGLEAKEEEWRGRKPTDQRRKRERREDAQKRLVIWVWRRGVGLKI